ncbi:MAG: hypothetical protein WAO98_10615 [Alphaproteobacteria bacterium]
MSFEPDSRDDGLEPVFAPRKKPSVAQGVEGFMQTAQQLFAGDRALYAALPCNRVTGPKTDLRP